MEFKHRVSKWIRPGETLPSGHTVTNGFFKEVWSDSLYFFSIGAYQDGDDDFDKTELDTVSELYRFWQEQKAGDEAVGQKGRWKYRFYHHDIVFEGDVAVDYVSPIKVYRRGNKVFWRYI